MSTARLHATHTTIVKRLVLPALVAGALLGGLVAGERTASALVIEAAPPAVRVEVVGRPPSPAHFWIPGYWAWRPGVGHTWVGGRWERSRPGWAWSRAHWAREGHRWRFAAGGWHHR